jgi:hypothetical protein
MLGIFPMRRTGNIWLVRSAALLVGVALGAGIWHAMVARTPRAAVTKTTPYPQNDVPLQIVRNGNSLRLTWDPDAPAIRSATGGALTIDDGGHRTELDLNPLELSSGEFQYWPVSANAGFRLTVLGTEVASRPVMPAVPEPEADVKPEPAGPPLPVDTAPRQVRTARATPREQDDSYLPPATITYYRRSHPHAAPVKAAYSAAPAPRHETEAERAQDDSPVDAASTAPAASPVAATEASKPEPQHRSWLRRTFGKIPVLRRLEHHPQKPPDVTKQP